MSGNASRVIVAGVGADNQPRDALVSPSGHLVVDTGAGSQVEIVDSATGAQVLNTAPVSDAGQRALAVRVISQLGAGAGGGGTQYAEDTVAVDAELLTMAGVVRKDARGTLVSTDGDRTELQVNASGDLRVDGSGVTQPVSGTFWPATQPISAVSLPLPTGASTDRTTAAGPFSVELSDGAAFYTAAKTGQLPAALVGGRLSVDASAVAVPVTDNAGSLTVDAPVGTPVATRLSDGAAFYDGTKTGQLPAALVGGRLDVNLGAQGVSPLVVADNQVIADNAAFTDGTTKLFVAGYIFDEVAGTALTENDAAAPRINANRATISVLEDDATRGRRATIKAASTAVAATDTALVVGISPNTPVKVNAEPETSGGCSVYRALAAATNNAAAIKASAGQVYGWYIFNAAATTRYVKLYNKATAPAPATDNALLVATLGIPAGGAANVFLDGGMSGFTSGIGIAIVTGIADTDNTSTTANDLAVNIFYK